MTRSNIPARRLLIWLAVILTGGTCGPTPAQAQAQAEHIVGRPKVLDGDTLEFAGQRVDLFGIDAPEAAQTCGAAAAAWNCGLEARWALINRIGRNWVTCVPLDGDGAGARVAVCYLAGVGQLDVAEWLAAQGWALADRTQGGAYLGQEAAAQAARKGLWRGAFEAPWDWRDRHPRVLE